MSKDKSKNLYDQRNIDTMEMVYDRTDAFTEFSAVSSDRVANELKPSLLSALGEEGYRALKDWSEVRYAGLKQGGMLYQHLYGKKGS